MAKETKIIDDSSTHHCFVLTMRRKNRRAPWTVHVKASVRFGTLLSSVAGKTSVTQGMKDYASDLTERAVSNAVNGPGPKAAGKAGA